MQQTLEELLLRSQSNALESRVTTLEVVARERMRTNEEHREDMETTISKISKRLELHEKVLWAIGFAAQAVLQDKYKGIAEAIKAAIALKSGS